MNEERKKYRYRGSLFFPFLLIVVGVLFLLDNLRLLPGDIWSTIFSLWPLILVGMGVDGLWRRQGVVTSVLFIGVGVVFLMVNMGYLNMSIFDFVLHFWPILLIAIGFDIFIGRRSMSASVIGLVLILVILAGAVWLFGVRISTGQVLSGEQINQPLQGVSSAQVSLSPAVGTLRLKSLPNANGLLVGQVNSPGGHNISQDYAVRGGQAQLNLRTTGSDFTVFPNNTSQWIWDLGLAQGVPVELNADMGAGRVQLDLTGVDLTSLKVNMGVGSSEVTLPQSGSYHAEIDQAIGEMVVWVPENVGVRINPDVALVVAHYPAGFQKQGDLVFSPNYSGATDQVDLRLNLAIGSVSVRYINPSN
ncbi:MAG: DUF5668 domain-containing protein [Anaerolineales bacterium]|jgi:hypothetical protein